MRYVRSFILTLAALQLAAAGVLLATGRLDLRIGAAAPESGHDHDHGHDHDAETAGAVRDGRILLAADDVRTAEIDAAPVGTRVFRKSLRLTGEIGFAEHRHDGDGPHVHSGREGPPHGLHIPFAHVTPRVAGAVREVFRIVGGSVEAGDPLCAIASPELREAESAFAAAVAERRLAEARSQAAGAFAAGDKPAGGAGLSGWLELDQAVAEREAAAAEVRLAGQFHQRTKQMTDKGLAPASEAWKTEAELRRAELRAATADRRIPVLAASAKTELARAVRAEQLARGRLGALGLGDEEIAALEAGRRAPGDLYLVRSPIAGRVIDRFVTVGQNFTTADKLFLIADVSEVWVNVAVPDRHLPGLAEGMPAVVRVAGLPDHEWPARLVHLGTRADEKTRTVPVEVAVRNGPLPGSQEPLGLRPGMFATVEFELSRREGVTAVPAAAVQSVDGRPAVFVRTPAEVAGEPGFAFEVRPVRTGAAEGAHLEILSGVKPGETVVVQGAFLLKSELQRSAIEEDEH
jgi:multidrug efflux pump subunit AcrA (membrane-fusion protein)